MSKRVLNPNQLQMFMKPSEIRQSLTGSIDMQPVDPARQWIGKHDEHLRDNIRRNGIKTPVILDHGHGTAKLASTDGSVPENPVTMGNGHHRVQNALSLEKAGHEIHVPVIHTEDDYMANRGSMYVTYPQLSRYDEM